MLLLCDTERHCQRRRSDRQAEYLDIDRLLVFCVQRKAYEEGACRSFADGLRNAGNGDLGIDEFRTESGEKLQRRKAEKAVRDGLAADQRQEIRNRADDRRGQDDL